MTSTMNTLGQPVGLEIDAWQPPPYPSREPMVGHWCRVEPLDPDRHAEDLYTAHALDATGATWTYLPYGPFASLDAYCRWIYSVAEGSDPSFRAIIDATTGKAAGVASYLRITPTSASIEVGHINYSPVLQRTPAATEAMYVMMRHVFELGYRRYEWKCDALNAGSRAAAQRLGFSFEGVFRQATVYKGRNRDTAWYAAIDEEWPALNEAFSRWLDPANFDGTGAQQTRLSEVTAPMLKQRG